MKRLHVLIALMSLALFANLVSTAVAQEAPAPAQEVPAAAPVLEGESPVFGTRGNPWTGVMQAWLRARGFQPGPVDSWYGNQTKAAVARFQQAAADAGHYSGPVDGQWSWDTSEARHAWGDDAPAPTPPPAAVDTSGYPCPQWHGLLQQYGLPVERFGRIMWRESHCDPGAVNRSSGARGLLQIMPQWATRWGGCEAQGICSPDQLLDPETNIRAAARIFALQGYRAWSQTA